MKTVQDETNILKQEQQIYYVSSLSTLSVLNYVPRLPKRKSTISFIRNNRSAKLNTGNSYFRRLLLSGL